jgi:hypothetical protein
MMEKIVGYIVVALLAAGALWKLNDMVADHYQAPVKAKLEAAETSRDAWQAAAKDEKAKRDELNATLVARNTSERKINSKLDNVNNELEQLKKRLEAVREWADTPIPVDVLRLRLDAEGTTTGTPSVQGGPSVKADGGRSGTTQERREESGHAEPGDGAGSSPSEVQPTTSLNQVSDHA